jgi:pSer/pThr/pTyr-binding forkhead associated (FHA) protein
LVFLSGPQAGEHALVTDRLTIAGRSPDAQIRLEEESVSRKQLQFELTREGWIVENLSSHGTRINGKRYKSGKKILLDTGDILGVGNDTQMFFVAPGDDPRQAMAEAGVSIQKEPLVPEPEPEDLPSDVLEEDAEPPEPQPKSTRKDRKKEAEESSENKTRKYILFGVLYGVGLVVLLAVILLRPSAEEVEQSNRPDRLTQIDINTTIEGALQTRMQIPRDRLAAEKMLEQARRMYRERDRAGNLYRAVKFYKLHLAHSGTAFAEVEDDRQFTRAKDKLKTELWNKYKAAFIAMESRQWSEAIAILQELRDMMIGVKEDPFPQEDNVIYDNIMKQLGYAKRMRLKAKKAS